MNEKTTQPKTKSSMPGPISERGLVIAVVIIVAAAAIYFSYPWVKDFIAGRDAGEAETETAGIAEEPLTPLERLKQIEDRVTGLEDLAQGQYEANETDLATFEARLSALEQKVDTIVLSEGGTVDEGAALRLQALEREIEVLREALAQAGAFSGQPTTDFAQAVAQLAPPLYQSRAFEGELEQLRILVLALPTLEQATLSAPIATLSNHAGTGIPSMDVIRDAFNRGAVEALKTEGLAEDAGWWDKTWARIKGLVVIRRTDETDGSTLAGAISQAEQFLDQGQLAGAIGVVDGLPENAQGAFQDWRTVAGEREAAMAAYDTLVRFVPRGLGGLS